MLGDGKELWTSGPIKKGDGPKTVSVPIIGVQHLTLQATGEKTENANKPGEDGRVQWRNAPRAAWLDGKVSGRAEEGKQ